LLGMALITPREIEIYHILGRFVLHNYYLKLHSQD
jgi:hypothetical protein